MSRSQTPARLLDGAPPLEAPGPPLGRRFLRGAAIVALGAFGLLLGIAVGVILLLASGLVALC